MASKTAQTVVLFDGACHLCSREISHYRKLNRADLLEFVDISAPTFEPAAYGVQTAAINRDMHVRRPDGQWAIGVDAFVAIWETLPRYQWAARFARRAPIHALLRAGYSVFTRIRPHLPRRLQRTCQEGACDIASHTH